MTGFRPRRTPAALLWLVIGAVAALMPRGTRAEEALPPSPYLILGSELDDPRPLDAAPPCSPERDDSAKREAARLAGAEGRAGLQMPQRSAGAGGSADEALFALVRAARSAASPLRESEARGALELTLQRVGSAAARACGHLEVARLQLRAGLLPEVRNSVSRARRAMEPAELPAALEDGARFYRAESFHLAGRSEDALPLYRDLARTSGKRLAAAARLRLAELRAEEDPAAVAKIEVLLKASKQLGVDPVTWAPRVAEWALAHRNFKRALRWLQRAEEGRSDEEVLATIGIRRADVLLRLGRDEESREVLEQIASRHARKPVGLLATARLVSHEAATRGDPGDLRRLQKVIASENRGLSIYGRGLLAHQLVFVGAIDESLDVLVDLAYERPPSALVPHLRDDFDAVLLAASAAVGPQQGCAEFVARLGSRRALLLRHARVSQPFLLLGDCYLEFAMPRAALDVFRAIPKAFGPKLAKEVAFRSARAEFELGNLKAARAATEIGIPANEDVLAWKLLRAEVLYRDGRVEEAAKVLEPVLRAWLRSTRGDARPRHGSFSRALSILARSAVRYEAGAEIEATLREAIKRAPRVDPPVPAELLGEVTLIAAELRYRFGDGASAERLFARAASQLPPGPLRAQAAYRLGLAATGLDRACDAWRASASVGAGEPWSRMAEDELGISELREAVGLGGLAPRPRSAAR